MFHSTSLFFLFTSLVSSLASSVTIASTTSQDDPPLWEDQTLCATTVPRIIPLAETDHYVVLWKSGTEAHFSFVTRGPNDPLTASDLNKLLSLPVSAYVNQHFHYLQNKVPTPNFPSSATLCHKFLQCIGITSTPLSKYHTIDIARLDPPLYGIDEIIWETNPSILTHQDWKYLSLNETQQIIRRLI